MNQPARDILAIGDGSGVLRRVQAVLDRDLPGAALARPRITLSYAQSLDGCIAAAPGAATQISNPASQVLCHRLRDMHDAILVGVGTVLVDDPLLTTRHVPGRDPRPIIVDSRLRTPPDANLLRRRDASLIIATTERASRERADRLSAAGATVVRTASGRDGRVDLGAFLSRLPGLGLRSLMIEGGAGVITSVLKAHAADQLVLAVAPHIFGGVRGVQSLQEIDPATRPSLTDVHVESVDGDLIVYGELRWSRS